MKPEENPQISVVMGVFNGESQLEETIKGILNQTFSDFEFIVVDDGSTDGTAAILERCASRDKRIRVIRQKNLGLTRALIEGCQRATGQFIARQDAGDRSLPRRLETQLKFIIDNPQAVMVACGARFLTPNNELLFEVVEPGLELDRGLRNLAVGELKGPPHHGGTLFRREAYDSVGGYRPEFRLAQDIDLWLRLCEAGKCLGGDDLHYEAVLEPGSISINRHQEQLYFQNLAIQCALARQRGTDEVSLLTRQKPPRKLQSTSRNRQAAYHYFIAQCLRATNKDAAIRNLNRAIRNNPFHIKALLRRIIWSLD